MLYKHTEYFFCGPEEMMQMAMELLKERGVERDRIHRQFIRLKSLMRMMKLKKKKALLQLFLTEIAIS